MRRRPEVPNPAQEIAHRLVEAHAEEALYEAECLAILHRGHLGERLYAEVLAEVRRRIPPCPLLPAG